MGIKLLCKKKVSLDRNSEEVVCNIGQNISRTAVNAGWAGDCPWETFGQWEKFTLGAAYGMTLWMQTWLTLRSVEVVSDIP